MNAERLMAITLELIMIEDDGAEEGATSALKYK
jgi:hypothetical protein